MMLRVEGLDAGYGDAQALFGVSFAIGAGEAVTLIGRNGMGKTTTIRAIMGLNPPRGGSVHFEGGASTACRPTRSPGAASVWCPRVARSSCA